MITASDLILDLSNNEENKDFKLASVAALFDNKTAKIQFDGEETPSEKQYAYLSSYTPAVGDRVLLGVLGGTYVILGKVNYNVTPPTEEEVDRYLFDLKKVIMQMGLSVTGSTDLESLTADETAIDGNLGISGTVTAQEVSASGQMSARSAAITEGLQVGSVTVSGALKSDSITPNGTTFYLQGNLIHTGTSIGFFNRQYPATKQSVNKITTSNPDNTELKNKINEFIGAIQWYNLLGGN